MSIEKRRRILQEEFGHRFLTVAEAAAQLHVTPQAIYMSPENYQVTRYDGSTFVPAPIVEEKIGERRARIARRREQQHGSSYLEVRGVEHEDGVGRMDVIRHLCIPCRRFYRSRSGYESHDCQNGVGRGGQISEGAAP